MSFTSIPDLALPTLPFQETEETVRSRMNSNVAPDWAQDQGTVLAIFREIGVAEVTKLYDALNVLFLQMFPSWATGDFLDAHAAAYGIQRSSGTVATGLIRFSGTPGTGIGPSTVASQPSTDPTVAPIRYQTVNVSTVSIPASGYIDIAAQAVNQGIDGNCAAGAVSYLETNLYAPVTVTNPVAMVGGTDPDDDTTLRLRILTQAALPVGSGTVNDYNSWPLAVPGVGRVDVTPLWDTSSITGSGGGQGNGTVGVSVRDPNGAPLDWAVVQEVQKAIDPSRQLLALLEVGEQWAADPETYAALNPPASPQPSTTTTGGTVIAGAYQIAVSYVNAFGETTASATVTVNTSSATSTITIPSPPPQTMSGSETNATGWYAYVSQAGGSTLTRQQTAGSPTAIGANLTLTAPPSATGAAPPASNTTAAPQATVAYTTAHYQTGQAALALTSASASGVAAAELVLNQDLSRFEPTDTIQLWLYSANWANVRSTLSFVRFHMGEDNSSYYQAQLNQIASSGTLMPSSGAGWWQWIVQLNQFTGTVGSSVLDWAAVTKVDIGIYSTVIQETDADYFRIISSSGAAGYGLAPIGAAVTVYTPTTQPVNVTANVRLASGVSLTGTAGTANATQLITDALNTYFQTVAPGTTALVAGIFDAIFKTPGVINVQLTAPAADVPISVSRYPVLGTLALNLY